MRFLASFALLVVSSLVVGCEKPAAKAPDKPAVDVQAPGVDVKVGGGDVEVKAPGVDIETAPGIGTDVKVESK